MIFSTPTTIFSTPTTIFPKNIYNDFDMKDLAVFNLPETQDIEKLTVFGQTPSPPLSR